MRAVNKKQYVFANIVVIILMMIGTLVGVWELPFRITAAKELIGFCERTFGEESRIAVTLSILLAAELRKSAVNYDEERRISQILAPICRSLLVRCERLAPVPENLYVKCANTLFSCEPPYPDEKKVRISDALNVHKQVLRCWGKDSIALILIHPSDNEDLLNYQAYLHSYSYPEGSSQLALTFASEARRLGKLYSQMLPQYLAFDHMRAVGEHYLNADQYLKSLAFQSVLLRNIPDGDKGYAAKQKELILHRIRSTKLAMSGNLDCTAYCAWNSNLMYADKPGDADFIE